MNIGHFITLTGMFIEIIGAFALSAEAIGLDRLWGWVRALSVFRERSSGREEPPPDSALRPNAQRILMACTCGIGSGVGTYLGTHPPGFASHLPRLAFGLFAALLGGIVAVLVYQIILAACSALIALLSVVESRTRAKSVGVVGFVLLLFGFILQFAGTFAQMISP